jgi:hypothetical protein
VVVIICGAVVIGAFDQDVRSVHVSGFNKLKQMPTGL